MYPQGKLIICLKISDPKTLFISFGVPIFQTITIITEGISNSIQHFAAHSHYAQPVHGVHDAVLAVLLRFGRALARLRSQYQEEVKRDAKRVIKHNLKQTKSTLDFKASHKWIKWANLQPVLDCLLNP